MRSETVKHIVKYYGGIPEAIKLLKRERDALEEIGRASCRERV